jgi:ribosome biogenesis GTPase
MEDYYNPLAPGDRVHIEADPLHPGTGRIIAAEERRNILTRFNQKGQKSQILAANIDLVLCMASPLSPPFRPRFLDRLLVQAEISGITPVILCNKWDLFSATAAADPQTEERLSDYRRIGYQALRISVKTGLGLEELRSLIKGKTSALMGQSGVGKTSLVNALSPGLLMKTGAVNEKYDRGNHTTALSVMLELPGFEEPTFLIDTPGIRRMVPDGITAENLTLYMKEFAEFSGRCTYGLSCSHRSEPGCSILEAVANGTIHRDRYESFLRIGDELAAL